MIQRIEISQKEIDIKKLAEIIEKFRVICKIDAEKEEIVIYAPEEVMRKILVEYNFIY